MHLRSLIRAIASGLEYSTTVKLLTEHHLEFLSLKGAAQTRSSLFMSYCHIVGNLMLRFNNLGSVGQWLKLLQSTYLSTYVSTVYHKLTILIMFKMFSD